MHSPRGPEGREREACSPSEMCALSSEKAQTQEKGGTDKPLGQMPVRAPCRGFHTTSAGRSGDAVPCSWPRGPPGGSSRQRRGPLCFYEACSVCEGSSAVSTVRGAERPGHGPGWRSLAGLRACPAGLGGGRGGVSVHAGCAAAVRQHPRGPGLCGATSPTSVWAETPAQHAGHQPSSCGCLPKGTSGHGRGVSVE